MDCPACKSNFTIRKGFVRRKRRSFQRFKCNDCGCFFTEKRLPNKSFDPEIIVFAITAYNNGATLSVASAKTNKKFHSKIYPQLLSVWLKEFLPITPYQKIRKQTGKMQAEPIAKKAFFHQQTFEFAFHKVKIQRFINNYFLPLRRFLEKLPQFCPNSLFQEQNYRCSQTKIEYKPKIACNPDSHACKASALALAAVKDNKKRHSAIQEFFLCNDSVTIATEVPIWLYPHEYNSFSLFNGISSPIVGHIDLVQIRFGLLYVLDYKPDAEKAFPIAQLFTYALALSKRTGIWLRNIKCAWFNENIYKEFFPSEIILKNESLAPEEKKKYLLNPPKRVVSPRKPNQPNSGKTNPKTISSKPDKFSRIF